MYEWTNTWYDDSDEDLFSDYDPAHFWYDWDLVDKVLDEADAHDEWASDYWFD